MSDIDAAAPSGVLKRRAGLLITTVMLGLCSCADAGEQRLAGDGAAPAIAVGTGDPVALFVGDTGQASSGAIRTSALGAFLSGRVAQQEQDFPAALAFYQDALAQKPDSFEIANQVMALAINEGRFDVALPISAQLAGRPETPLATLIQVVELAKTGNIDKATELADRLPRQGFQLFAGSFARAWLRTADPHQLDKAVAELAVFGQEKQLATLKTVHTVLMQDLDGDADAAASGYNALLAAGAPPLRLVELAGNFFERQGKIDQAKAVYQHFADEGNDTLGITPALSLNGPPPRIIASAQDGLAEAMFDLATLLGEADAPEVAMLSVRLALRLKPDFPLAQIVLADELSAEHRPQDAISAYRKVDTTSPFAWTARLRLASSLAESGDKDGADTLLTAMAAERPTRAEPLIELGDDLRAREQFSRAAETYTEALNRLGSKLNDHDWSLYFSRGIAYERSGQWPAAEADLRKSLTMKPKEAAVLNYLGYSLVDRRERLPEALTLIKEAVEIRPSDGFIVDSLGWAYYRMGDYKNAQGTLERAVELEPADPEINDHLGDAYWQGGRREEARLQWRRALDLKPTPDLANKIAAKLDHPPHAAAGTTTAHGGG